MTPLLLIVVLIPLLLLITVSPYAVAQNNTKANNDTLKTCTILKQTIMNATCSVYSSPDIGMIYGYNADCQNVTGVIK